MGSKPRVLHLITKMVACGGASKTANLIALYQNQALSAFEAGIACGPPEGGEDELDTGGTPRFSVPDLVRPVSPHRDWRAYRQIRQLLREFRPAVVHTHSSKAGALGRLAARSEGIPAVVHHVHGWSFHPHMPVWQRGLFVRVERGMCRCCDGLLFVAQNDIDIARQCGIGTPGSWHMIRSGLEVGTLLPATPENRAHARDLLGLPHDAFVVGTVAQLRPQKSPADFVATARLVANQIDKALFVWIGDGPQRAQTEELAQAAGIADRIVFAGPRADVGRLYAGLDAFILTSLWEGLPRTVVEAMVAGVPVVATSVPGTMEVVRHGITGMLAAPGDVERLAECIIELHASAPLRDRLVRQAVCVSEEFSISKTVADLERLYSDLLESKAWHGNVGPSSDGDVFADRPSQSDTSPVCAVQGARGQGEDGQRDRSA